MAQRLTTFSKFLITLLIVAALFFAGRYFLMNTEAGQKMLDQAEQTAQSDSNTGASGTDKRTNTAPSRSGGDDDVLTVQIFTWGGYAPGIYFNNGFDASENSRYYKDYGFKVKFELIDDFNASRQAWKADQVDLIGSTADALPTEMEGLGRYEPQVIFQCDWSRGGDAIVVKRGIKTANDLKGKKVAFTPSTPSQTFLTKTLDAAGLTLNDIEAVDMPDNIAAATAFKSGNVDAAVVWSPDDEIAVREVAGAKVLQSTREASHVIADVFLAKKSFAEANREKLRQFYEGWMKGAAEINSNKGNKELAAKLLGEGTGLPVQDALGAIANVRLTTHGDNQAFFGLDTRYKGVTGEDLYTQMGQRFEKLGFAPADRPDWRRTAYPRLVSSTNLEGPTHRAEGAKAFNAPSPQTRTLPAIATKPVRINFNTGQFKLSENAKTIIDLQFADIAKSFGNTRIRIEGNTDNVGKAAMNKSLSLKRAQSVADYLVNQYQMDRNRFVIVGNGPDNPVKGCEKNQSEDCKARNRRTDFQLIPG